VIASCLLAVVLSAAGAEEAAAERVAASLIPRSRTAAKVEARLESDQALLNQHRGYLAFLRTHPEAAAAEEALAEHQVLSTYRNATDGFDEALLRNPALQQRSDEYFRFLGDQKDLRRRVEALERVEMDRTKRRDTWGPAMAYLRAHPDKALAFLRNPTLAKPTPEALRPLLSEFKKESGLRSSLLKDFQNIHEAPGAHLKAFPWWQGLNEAEGDVAENYQQMMAHLKAHPTRFWVWQRGQVALAQTPGARDWMRYWRRKIRRDEALRPTYWAYLQELRGDPEKERATEARWAKQFGPPPQWPPVKTPPKLTPMPSHKTLGAKGSLSPTVPRPAKPSVPRPSRLQPRAPRAPRAPTRPTRPRKAKPSATEKN
jgi:hypothetical protein